MRDPLPLRLPPAVAEQAEAAQGEQESLAMPERGPEITELR